MHTLLSSRAAFEQLTKQRRSTSNASHIKSSKKNQKTTLVRFDPGAGLRVCFNIFCCLLTFHGSLRSPPIKILPSFFPLSLKKTPLTIHPTKNQRQLKSEHNFSFFKSRIVSATFARRWQSLISVRFCQKTLGCKLSFESFECLNDTSSLILFYFSPCLRLPEQVTTFNRCKCGFQALK
jgi:hypothetical protein